MPISGPLSTRQARLWLQEHGEDLDHYSSNPDAPVLFYGGAFSNFVGGPFVIKSQQPWSPKLYERMYRTVEHFFQASKCHTRVQHNRVANISDTWEAKAAGQCVRIRSDWESFESWPYVQPVKFFVMLHGLRVKFAQPNFRTALLATGDRYIAEDSPTDYIWGIRDANGGWTGDNLLGHALMCVRRELMTR